MSTDSIQAISAAVSAIATIVIAWLTCRTIKVSERLATLQEKLTEIEARNLWYTGALESHSTLMLQIEAARGLRPGQPDNKPIDMVWWDPDFGGNRIHRHQDPIDLSQIRFSIPPDQRAGAD